MSKAVDMIKQNYEKTVNGGKWVEMITKDVKKAQILENIHSIKWIKNDAKP